MSWKALLNREIETTYKSTVGLMDLVEEGGLDWKPSQENNWMTTGQLLMHLTNGCGMSMKGFVTGDWGLPDGVDYSEMAPEEMLPPAEKLPAVDSVAQAKKLIAEDKQVALDMVAQCSEEDLKTKIATAPWDPTEMVLGHRLLQMVEHLKLHKAQLFYYLKIQGKPVNTGHMWGM
jgi:hypothetical protein